MYNNYMIKHQIKNISSSTATSLDISENIRSAYTLVVQNTNSSGFIYLGNENVSSSNYGFKLYPAQSFTVELSSRSRLYAVASINNLPVAVMEIDRAI